MIRVEQRNETDSGVCCIAMLLGMGYTDTLKKAFLDWFSRSNFSIKFENFKNIFSNFKKTAAEHDSFNGALERSGILEATFEKEGKTIRHYVVYDHQTRTVLDPRKTPAEYKYHRFLTLLR